MQTQQHPQPLRIGIDIGGTFTDFVIFHPTSGDIQTFKVPSTPHDPSAAVISGLKRIDRGDWQIIHGSTVATNALLERKGAKTALVTTKGFKDVLQIGRQNRPELYNFASRPVEPLVPASYRFEITERVGPNGDVLTALDPQEVEQIINHLKQMDGEAIESLAVVFLFSFANPQHETFVAQKLRQAGYFVSSSCEILPEYREYERTSTTVVNAYVSPVLDRYLEKLENTLKAEATASLQIMQSNGGCISVGEARQSGVRCVLSGPAGGVVGCQYVGSQVQSQTHQGADPIRLLTFDMGGTSTDVALIDGQPKIASDAEVGGHPIRVPLLDIHTIGAGGGSIAYADAGGILRVGPESAGAIPGPACYGRSAERVATVTDANLFLGRIPADYFLGGEMPLYPERASQVIEKLAEQLHLSATETALGIIEIANAHMERALRVISVERGYDPRDFALLSFGGAGSLHASDLARRLRIPRVIIPPYASTLSAFGMLTADVIKDYTQTVMLPHQTPYPTIQAQIHPLVERGSAQIQAEGFQQNQIQIETFLDMRYQGQSFELTIPMTADFEKEFHQTHLQTYGYQRREAAIEIVNLRVRATGLVAAPQMKPAPTANAESQPAPIDTRTVIFPDGPREIGFYRAEHLKPGNQIEGPGVIVRNDTTILLQQNDLGRVDPFHNLIIEVQS